jgi:Tol biopolymer transport system component/tRNA A-37 threonylcarbamoyl transferase component Bud32
VIGKTLNHYRVVHKLASGGMGEVYVARDTTLDRDIVLKLLPAEMAADPERRARMDREAKAIAALNHPNIVTIHSIEESDGVHFLTMELVPGAPLSKLISRKGMALDRLLDIAVPLAAAMGAAHEKGITHRDLKPANIMVSDDGRVKILDFGLAKFRQESARELADTQAPAAVDLSQTGRVLGTVAYMSPEQAEGKSVDPRSDVFSLGVLLYELATGQRPFRGDSKVSILSSVLRDTPTSITELNRDLPLALGRIIRRCLAKDRMRRYLDARELHNELLELKEEIDSGESLQTAADVPVRKRRKTIELRYAAIGITTVLAASIGFHFLAPPPRPAAPPPVTVTQVTDRPGEERFPNLSPDGRTVFYAGRPAGNWDIFMQRVGGEKVFNLTQDSPLDDTHPALSPSGDWIAFRSERDGGGIFLMGATGESVKPLTDSGYLPTWAPDGTEIAYATQGFDDPMLRQPTSRIHAIDLSTRDSRLVAAADATQPQWSPHGHRIAYWGLREGGQRDIWTVPAAGGEPVAVTNDPPTDWSPAWSPDGNFIYFSSDRGGTMSLWSIPVEEITGEILGPPQPVTTGVLGNGYQKFSGDGRRLAYTVDTGTLNPQMVPFNPAAGRVTGPPVWITRGSRQVATPDLSPDGEWIAYVSWGSREDIFVMRTDGTARLRLTEDPHKDRWPRWSPDGGRIAFHSDRSGSYELWTINPDGTGLAQLTDTPGQMAIMPVWSPDGTRMAFNIEGTAMVFEPGGPWQEQTPELLPPWEEEGGLLAVTSWSPGGDRLAGYVIDSDGEFAGFAAYSLATKRYEHLIGPDRMTETPDWPIWLNDNRRLLFSDQGKILLLDRETGKSREVFSVEPDHLYISGVTRDNSGIYYVRYSPQADIWVLDFE